MTSYSSKIGDAATDIANDATDAAKAELAVLRAKVEALMRDRVTPVLADAAGAAEGAAHDAMDAVRRQTDSISTTVREQPLAAIGAAALFGVAVGLLLRR